MAQPQCLSFASAQMAATLARRMDLFRWQAPARASITTPSQTSSTQTGKDRTLTTGTLYRAEMWGFRSVRQCSSACGHGIRTVAPGYKENGISMGSAYFPQTKI